MSPLTRAIYTISERLEHGERSLPEFLGLLKALHYRFQPGLTLDDIAERLGSAAREWARDGVPLTVHETPAGWVVRL